MKRKLLALILATLTVASAAALSACDLLPDLGGSDNSGNTGTTNPPDSGTTGDNTDKDNTDKPDDGKTDDDKTDTETPKHTHEFENEVCKICGYHTPTEGLQYILNEDAKSYSVIWAGTFIDTIYIADEYNGLPVTGIGSYAFCLCSVLTSVTIPDSVTSIGDSAFYACSKLTSIEIPSSVTSIGVEAFSRWSRLTSIVVNKNNKNYYSEGNCLIEKESITLILGCKNSVIPNDVTNIGANAFYMCDLTSINIPDSVTSIGNYAFYWCSALTSINIPDSVTSIGDFAFYNCSGLTSIEIPNSVTSIGDSAFERCDNLTIYCEAEEQPEGWYSSWNYSDCPVVWGYKGEE